MIESATLLAAALAGAAVGGGLAWTIATSRIHTLTLDVAKAESNAQAAETRRLSEGLAAANLVAQISEQYRQREMVYQAQVEEVNTHAAQAIEAARADAAAAADAARVRNARAADAARAAAHGAAAAAAADTVDARVSAAIAAADVVYADMLRGLDARGREAAGALDIAHAEGTACERERDALTTQTETPAAAGASAGVDSDGGTAD